MFTVIISIIVLSIFVWTLCEAINPNTYHNLEVKANRDAINTLVLRNSKTNEVMSVGTRTQCERMQDYYATKHNVITHISI
jgi:hypothetical protein